MSTPSNPPSVSASHRPAGSAPGAGLHAAARLIAGLVFITLAARAFHGPVSLYQAALLGGALAVAAGLGLVMGLLAAAIAVLAGDPAWRAHLQLDALGRTDILFASAVGATLAGVGYATDLARRRRRLARVLPKIAQPPRPPSSPDRRAHVSRLVTAVRSPARPKARRMAAGLALALAGGGLALAFHKSLSPAGVIALALGPALLAAEWTSAACGVLAVGLAAGLLAWLFPGAGIEARLSRAVGVALASALGWRIGALAQSARRERDLCETLVQAAHRLADCGDEAAVGPVLRESRQRIERNAGSARTANEAAAALTDMAAVATARARLAAEMTDMESSTRAEQLRTILLDAVSHHFRSPLAGILGSVTSILSLPQPHERGLDRQFLLIIKEQANRLSRYVDNFLSLARLEAGAIEINPSDVNLEVLIYDVWDSFGASGGARRYLDVELEIDAMRSDAGLLTQIFGNLLENAIKYSPEESVVAVRGRRQGDDVQIEIVDEGCGAPEAALERMFARFHRMHSAKTPGMGLGLYITRSLVEMLGGRISARNREDGRTGLAMSMTLPLNGATS